MLASTISDEDAGPYSPTGASGLAITPADMECRALTRIARFHFGVATAMVTLLDARGQRIHAIDGSLPHMLPPDLSGPPFQASAKPDRTVVVPDTWDDERFGGKARDLAVRWPRFYASCGVTGADGRHLGALCLLDDLPHSLDDAQREFLRELAGMVAHGLERAHAIATLRNRVEELETGGELMTLALAGSGTGIWDRNVVTGTIDYSPAWKAMLGYEGHELSNRMEDAYLRLHPDDRAYVHATMQSHFENRTDSYVVEHRIRCKDGSYKWICSRGKVVERGSNGHAMRMVGTSTDITALREMAAQLQQSIEMVTNLTDEVPGMVFQYRRMPDGLAFFPYTSEGIRDIYELTPQQAATGAATIDALIDARDLAAYRESLEESAASLLPWHLEYRVRLPRQGLRWRQGDARPRRLDDGSTLWHGFITDVTDRKHIEAELQELATIDFLTQLPNRRHFMMQSEAELARIRRAGGRVAAVLMFDLDHFKALNDRWGHAAGDSALSHFAALLRAEVRAGDIVGRLGGEEFAMVLPNTDTDAAIALAGRVQHRTARTPLQHGDEHLALTVSIGIDIMRVTDIGAYQSLSRGDKALYRAKERGRNRIEIYGDQCGSISIKQS
ncbi:diguanylate cyclase [Paraburkholderia dioscoreae]|uniref:PAS domain S-box/diguanylate cyclase (GGDEF) domain-containing protein n=1 Tax=Paraburkholderia dioscoreae TaxID=2604047 RepID=A0A5Q4YVD6_9BURK|nr:diguanylate cyclase [Paraburkholderia dioscoreae]VVD31695.1 PAS domain S-box/diguanylate cyclase (GGDEF) domain-containing protein [Paraburkholderia dioscoreae]